jgi:hypothetical protein
MDGNGYDVDYSVLSKCAADLKELNENYATKLSMPDTPWFGVFTEAVQLRSYYSTRQADLVKSVGLLWNLVGALAEGAEQIRQSYERGEGEVAAALLAKNMLSGITATSDGTVATPAAGADTGN